jgi:peptidoglycan/LPS O-acetylase OafA/YrhL
VVPLIIGAFLLLHGARSVDILAPRGRVELSYGLPLLHATAFFLVAPLLGGVNDLLGYADLVAPAMVIAAISWRCWEPPTTRRPRSTAPDRKSGARVGTGPSHERVTRWRRRGIAFTLASRTSTGMGDRHAAVEGAFRRPAARGA